MDGDDYQSHNVDTIRTVPCDASFSLSGTLLVALRPLFGWNMDLSDRLFFGIGGGAVTAWKFGQSVLQHQKRIETEPDGKKKKKRVSFNRHI